MLRYGLAEFKEKTDEEGVKEKNPDGRHGAFIRKIDQPQVIPEAQGTYPQYGDDDYLTINLEHIDHTRKIRYRPEIGS